MQLTPNRIVVLLTPVFVGLSGSIAAWAANNLPGAPSLSKGDLTAVFIAVASAAFGMAFKWLDGHQKHEARIALPKGGTVVTNVTLPPAAIDARDAAERLSAELERRGLGDVADDEPGDDDALDAVQHTPPAAIPADKGDGGAS